MYPHSSSDWQIKAFSVNWSGSIKTEVLYPWISLMSVSSNQRSRIPKNLFAIVKCLAIVVSYSPFSLLIPLSILSLTEPPIFIKFACPNPQFRAHLKGENRSSYKNRRQNLWSSAVLIRFLENAIRFLEIQMSAVLIFPSHLSVYLMSLWKKNNKICFFPVLGRRFLFTMFLIRDAQSYSVFWTPKTAVCNLTDLGWLSIKYIIINIKKRAQSSPLLIE